MVKFFGTVRHGILHIKNKSQMLKEIEQAGDGDVECHIIWKKRRSLRANAYYWGIVVRAIRLKFEDLGNIVTDEETHEFLKDKFNSKAIVGDGGEYLGEVGQSTTNLGKEEFGLYLEKIISWSAQTLEIRIEPPNTDLILWNDPQ